MKFKLVTLMLISLLLMACSLPTTISSLLDSIRQEPTPLPESNSLLDLVAEGRVSIISVTGNLGVGSFSGRMIDLELHNNSQVPLEVEAPCGLVFISADEDTSRMMTVQPVTIILDDGETKVINPFVLSTDALKSLPSPDKTYRVERLEDGKQRQLAECLCQQDLPAETETQELLSLQLAAWMIDSDSVIATLPDTLDDLLNDLTGLPISIPGLDEALQDLSGSLAPNAQSWLNRCEISMGEE